MWDFRTEFLLKQYYDIHVIDFSATAPQFDTLDIGQKMRLEKTLGFAVFRFNDSFKKVVDSMVESFKITKDGIETK